MNCGSNKDLSRHDKLATKVLDSLSKELDSTKIYYYRRYSSQPYNIFISLTITGPHISFFCGGFSKAIYIQRLTNKGTLDRRTKEVRYLTPKGAANYIKRKYVRTNKKAS